MVMEDDDEEDTFIGGLDVADDDDGRSIVNYISQWMY